MKFSLTRDSAIWWITAIGSLAALILTAKAQEFLPFPLTDSQQHWIMLIASVSAWFSGKLASSPLPHSVDADTVTGRRG